MLEKLFNGRLSVSVTVFMLSSVVVRFFGLGCTGLALYMKYGDRLIDDDVLPGLNSIEIYGMQLGTFIQGVVFSTVVFFAFEFVNGIFGIYAGLSKRKNFLIAYICMCLSFILVCIVEIVLWSLMYYWINNALEENIETFHKRYSGAYLMNGYHDKWKALYNCLECCGTNGTGNTCSGVYPSDGVNFPGCFDLYSEKMNLYIQVYLGIIIVCILCQIVGIAAADYTVIKQQMKSKGVKKLSSERRYLLCMKEYGVFRTFLKFLKGTWNRTPTCIVSVIFKMINVVSSVALMITSLWFIRSDFVTNQEFLYFFRRMDVYGYSYHNVFTGFACCTLAIGTFGIVISVIGLVGSTKQSTALHTVAFFSSIGIGGLKIIASIFWAVMLREIIRHVEDELYELSGTDIFYTTLMLKFECCVINTYQQTGTQQQDVFCYSNMHESIVNYGHAWNNHKSYIHEQNGPLYGSSKDVKWCFRAIGERLLLISVYYFSFFIIGIICDFVGPILISKEFKENQRVNVEKEIKEGEAMHLIPWLNHLFRRDKPRSLLLSLNICLGVFMMLLEMSFIVLAAIFGVSNHVNREYIDKIGDLYGFLAIGSLVLVSCCMIIRIVALIIVFKRWKKSLYVITTFVTINTLLTLTFLIMGSVLRNDEYPCIYYRGSSNRDIDCSSAVESTSGVALGMFIIELFSQICALIIHDRIHQYTAISGEITQTDENKQPGLFMTVYFVLFVDRQLFKNNRKLGIPVALYVGASIVMTLLEITFIVLVCFYGFAWLLDRRWITTGLYLLRGETINMGVLFDFLKISLLAMIPIISVNRMFGVVAVLTRRKNFLYVVSGVQAFTFVVSLIFLVLLIIMLSALNFCTLDSESCPSRRYAIVGVAVAMIILEILIQAFSFLVHDRCYKYFLPEEDTESLIDPDQQKGLYLMMYDRFFRRRENFSSGKIEALIGVHFVLAVVFLMVEMTLIVLVSLYGLSSAVDRQWITSGLSSMHKISMNLEVVFQFLTIGCLVLLPLISLNRIIGIISVSCRWIKVLYLNSVIMAFTLSINLVFICLGAILLHEESKCQYTDESSRTVECQTMRSRVGLELAIFSAEFLMQVFSVAVNDRSHKYIATIELNKVDETTITDEGKGLFLMIYDKTFRRRKPFANAVKTELLIAVYSTASVIVLMIEISFIVLNAVYGLSYVIDRKWITEGLSILKVISMDLEVLYKFLSVGSIVIIPIISINRFFGLISISTKWTKVLYMNSIIMTVTFLVNLIFVVLTSMLLSAENRCHFTDVYNEYSCPEMKYIVGVLLSVLIIELLMQIFSFCVNDRSYKHIMIGKDEGIDDFSVTDSHSGLIVLMYNTVFRRRKPLSDAPKFEIVVGIYVICSILFMMIDLCFIVLVSIYGLSWLLNLYWVTRGLSTLSVSTIDLGVLYYFLAIGSIVLISLINANRIISLVMLSVQRKTLLYLNTVVNTVTILLSIIFVVLGSILRHAESRCKYNDGGISNCSRMNGIVGTGLAVLIAELLMQVFAILIDDRAFRHLFNNDHADKTIEGTSKQQTGLIKAIIDKTVLNRTVLKDHTQLKIPLLIITFTATFWMIPQILFWIGTILEFGSPRFINSTLMEILYDQSTHNINLGHLANGLAYTAIGIVPVILCFRMYGIIMMFFKKSTITLVTGIISVFLCLGSVTLFGLSTYHIQYVYDCFGSSEMRCNSQLTSILLSVSAVYLSFFLIETIVLILQCCVFMYTAVVLSSFKFKSLNIFHVKKRSSRNLKIINIVIRLFEMITGFIMLIAIMFFLSGVHIDSESFMLNLGTHSFHDTNLLNLARGLVITSSVTIIITLTSNIIGIIGVVAGYVKILTVTIIIDVILLPVELTALGCQGVIENRVDDMPISLFISFNVIQITCQIIHAALSLYDIKENNKARIADDSNPVFESRKMIHRPSQNVEPKPENVEDIEQ